MGAMAIDTLHAEPDAAAEALSRRAAAAVALAPLLVLLTLTLVISDVVDPHVGSAVVLAAVGWLAFEMHRVQRSLEDA